MSCLGCRLFRRTRAASIRLPRGRFSGFALNTRPQFIWTCVWLIDSDLNRLFELKRA